MIRWQEIHGTFLLVKNIIVLGGEHDSFCWISNHSEVKRGRTFCIIVDSHLGKFNAKLPVYMQWGYFLLAYYETVRYFRTSWTGQRHQTPNDNILDYSSTRRFSGVIGCQHYIDYFWVMNFTSDHLVYNDPLIIIGILILFHATVILLSAIIYWELVRGHEIILWFKCYKQLFLICVI